MYRGISLIALQFIYILKVKMRTANSYYNQTISQAYYISINMYSIVLLKLFIYERIKHLKYIKEYKYLN